MRRPARTPGNRAGPRDLTVVAIPVYFASMGAEYLWLRRRARTRGATAGDYEWHDTLASLAMGVGSLLAPLVVPRLLRPLTPGRGRAGKAVLLGALGAGAVTTVSDAVLRRRGEVAVGDGDRVARVARKVSSVGGVGAVVAGGVAASTTWARWTAPQCLWSKRILPDMGNGILAVAAAVAGWDFVYYWHHRFMHTSRYMWAIHVVHHSSEHYNLSTALRQPVADALGTAVPFGAVCLLGIRPALLETARGVNLLYQFWIHTETIGRIGAAEKVLNTPSHHRVHHGSNGPYLDRNHGSILILWDRLFGTFEPEDEPVVYGLTENIETYNPARIATHEYVEMLRDVGASTSWRERLSYVLRGPGWATTHRAGRAGRAGRAESVETDRSGTNGTVAGGPTGGGGLGGQAQPQLAEAATTGERNV